MDWNKPAEIVGRCTIERNLFRDGVYSNNGKALVYTATEKRDLGKATTQIVADLLWLVPETKPVPQGGVIYPPTPAERCAKPASSPAPERELVIPKLPEAQKQVGLLAMLIAAVTVMDPSQLTSTENIIATAVAGVGLGIVAL